MKIFVAIFLYIISFFFCPFVKAALTPTSPSIKRTAETLKKKSFELGLENFAYGITDELMFKTFSALGLYTGFYSTRIKYKVFSSEKFTASLGAGIAYSGNDKKFHPNGEFWTSYYFGEKKHHALNFGCDGSTSIVRSDPELNSSISSKSVFSGACYFGYDYYTPDENLFWISYSNQLIVTMGFTWAWDNFHFGLMSIGDIHPFAVGPLPYFSWRLSF